jgi:hypothetical protein
VKTGDKQSNWLAKISDYEYIGNRREVEDSKSVPLDSPVESQSHVRTDGQSVSPSWCRAPSGLMTRYKLLFDSYGFIVLRRPL